MKGVVFCHYCRCHLAPTKAAAERRGNANMLWTKDHFVAKAHGGTEVVPCCLRCNQAKEAGCPHELMRFADIMLKGKSPRIDTREALLMFRAWTMRSLF